MLSGSHKDENGKYQFLDQHEEERDPLLRLRTKYGSTEQDETGRALELDSESARQEEIIKDDEIPVIVRESVALEDDVNLPVITFRYFLLSTLFVIPGAFIDTMNTYRTTAAAYSIFFVQIACHWAGKWLAEVLPKKRVSVFRWSFNLNPGPWSIKETAMITITASSGATGNLATNAISLADLRFGEKVHPATAIAFMWAIVFVGYSYGAIAKDLVLYDPQLPWPQALMQTTLLQTQEKADKDPKLGGRRMKLFFTVLGSVAIWQLFPEYIFPMTSSLAILCWIAPYNKVLNFLGSGLGGMGVLNFSLDWANINSTIMLYPYWVQVIQFIAFVIGAWILLPIAKWSSLISYHHGLMSNSLFTTSGEPYPSSKLLNDDLTFNQKAYEKYGPVLLGAQRAWNIFFDYAAYISGVVWILAFRYDDIVESIKRHRGSKKIVHTDVLNKLQNRYDPVPNSWYLILFTISFVTLMTIFLTGQMFMPWWCCVVGLVLGAIIVTPLAWLYALSNFQLAIGTFNELFYGYLVQGQSKIHPVSGAVFGSIAGDAWYRAQFHLQCMRIGFYNHLPPKAVFLCQLYGELIGVPINYLAVRWVLSTKRAYLDGSKVDPLHQWTAQGITSLHSNAIQYVVLGPSRLFENYRWLPYGFLLGLVGPLVIFALYKRFPHSKLNFQLWNTTVFFSSMTVFYGNISTGYLSKFLGGTVAAFWAFHYHHALWQKYNYIMAAAFDTGYNLAVLIIFGLYSAGLVMPNWWGNNEKSVERCFAL